MTVHGNDHGKDDLAHATRRMLQALDAYWEFCEGSGRRHRWHRDSLLEDWWTRFVRYRRQVESMLPRATHEPQASSPVSSPSSSGRSASEGEADA